MQATPKNAASPATMMTETNLGVLLHRARARLRAQLGLKSGDALEVVLVEDTLQHQKAARRVGMKTVWMQRWTRAAAKPGARFHLKPPYVDVRTRSLRALRSLR